MLFVGLVAIATAAIAGTASAKVDIAEANITGPGLEERLTIESHDTYGLWETGIGTDGGLNETRADSVEELGLTPAELGPTYVVTYRFGIGRATQDLYPYAKGGPVTYTAPGQELGRRPNTPDFLRNLAIVAGWYQSSHPAFFQYLVDQGLPRTNPVPSVATDARALDTAPRSQTAPWMSLMLILVALAALSLAALAVRHRLLTTTRRPSARDRFNERGLGTKPKVE